MIRGIACLIVLFAHIVASDAVYGKYANGCGKIGVWCFLILSGFLSFLPFSENPSNENKVGIRYIVNYYGKKIRKLYPAYIVILLIALAVGFIGTWKDVLKHIFLAEGYGHFWYMPVILKFYLIFPLLLIVYNLMKESKIWYAVFIIILGTALCFIFPFTECQENSIQIRWYFPVFLMGIVLSLIYSEWKNKHLDCIIWDITAVAAVCIILLLTPFAKKVFWGIEPSGWLQNKYLLVGMLWSVFLLSVLFSRHLIKLLDGCRFLKWIGSISYELYLIHYLVLYCIKSHINNTFVRGIFVIIVSTLLAAGLHMILGKCKRMAETYKKAMKE